MEVSKRARKAVDVTLDAEVWGKLQDHISLQVVYDKLSHKDLLRLRLVCKEWNHAALQRLEPKPYFVIIQVGDDEMILNGILSYFSYKRQQRPPLRYEGELAPVVVDGLILCNHPNIKHEQGVFNVHTKTWHAIPPAPERSDFKSVCGMVVDTAERPYSFKLVVGSCDKKTQIYDSKSRSWQTLSSRLGGPQFAGSWFLIDIGLEHFRYVTCVCSQGYLYMSLGVELLLMYSVEGDVWTSLQFPSVDKGEYEDSASYEDFLSYEDWLATHALGEWEGRIFTSREEAGKGTVQVWELVDQKSWVEYASMSVEEYGCLMRCSDPHPDNQESMVTVPCFCNGFLLVYNWQFNTYRVDSLMMLNLATKEWKHVDLPMGTVAVEASDSEEGSDSEEVSDSEEGSDNEEDFDSEEDDEVAVATFRYNASRAQRPSSTTGKIVMQPTSSKAEKPSSAFGKPVVKPKLDMFVCAVCRYDSVVHDDYEVHEETELHRVLEELHKENEKQNHRTPLGIIHEYVKKNQRVVKYESLKRDLTAKAPHEVIAIVEGAAGRSTGPPMKGFGASHHSVQQAKHMAAAAALERIMENVPDLELKNLVRQNFRQDRPGRAR